MRLTMDMRGGRRVRRLDETEASGTLGVVPISHVFDPVFVLNFKVLTVRFGDVFGSRAAHVMAVHEDWHDGLRLVCFGGSGRRSDVLVDAEQVVRIVFGFDRGEPPGVAEIS